MAQFTPVQGNPFEDKEKASIQPSNAPVFVDQTTTNVPNLPVPTKDTGEVLTGAKIPGFAGFKTFLGYMSTTEPKALQDIILSSVEGAVGGEDDKGNPYVVIGGKPFYTNKPGLSPVDAFGFVGDIIQFLPASKIATLGKGIATRLGLAGATTGTISATKEGTAKLLGSEQQFDTTKVLLDTAFGAGGQAVGDALTGYIRAKKPVFNSKGELSEQFKGALKEANIDINAFGEEGKKAIVESYKNLGNLFATQAENVTAAAKSADTGRLNIPLTKGQATGDVRQLASEEAMRNAARGKLAQNIMQRFDVKQSEAIKGAAGQVAENIAPGARASTQTEAGGSMYELLRQKQAQMKGAYTQAYSQADLRALNVPVEQVNLLPNRIGKSIQEANLVFDPELTPSAVKAFEDIKSAVPQMENVTIKDINLKSLESTRRKLNSYYSSATNDTDKAVIQNIRNEFDNWLDDTITMGLASGDEAQLANLKNARSLYKNYAEKFKVTKGTPDEDAAKIVEKLTTKDLTPVETINYLFGASKLGDNQTSVRVAKKMKDIFGENSEAFNEFRQAAYLRLVQDTQGNIKSPTKIVNELNELIMGKGQTLAKEIFTPEQVGTLKEFRDAVAKTITPAEAKNPSKTGYEIARLGEDLLKGLGILGAVSGDVGTAGVGTISALGVRPLKAGAEALSAVKGAQIPSLRGGYGASLAVPVGGAVSGLLREREEQQFPGLLR